MNNKGKLHRILSIYAIVNIAYLLLLLIFNLALQGLTVPSGLAFLFVFPASLVFYMLYKLPFVHILFHIIYLIISIIGFKTEKSRAKKTRTIIISASGILLNIFWLINGQPFLVN